MARTHRRPLLKLFELLAALTFALSPCLHAQVTTLPLNTGWRFRATAPGQHPEASSWRPAIVPGVVQTDLRAAGVIPDPFHGDNEKRLQWIGLTDWEYVDDFNLSSEQLQHAHLDLVFEGLDTFADISLNGNALLSADNQFRTWRADAKPFLHAGRNTLRIVFHSPTNLLTPIVARFPILIPGTGYEPLDRAAGIYPVSHYMRKAPYSYGWDWGPKFVTLGIWKPVHLDLWDTVRAIGFHLHPLSVTADRALAEAALDLTSEVSGPATLELRILNPQGRALPLRAVPVILDRGENHLVLPLRIDHPDRWYPNGYGPQSRYTVTATLRRGAKELLRTSLKTGLRSVELRRNADQWGTSFAFYLNGIPIFAKGANYIPLDSFLPDITDIRRRTLLTAARDVHMNMIRVWGGGVYEIDSFYDLCDELGLMVWQDFLFGGALVPGDTPFQQNVRAEAVEQVQRLSDHPSLVLWCGNNEVENAWREWPDHLAFEATLTPEQRERIWQDYVVLFRDILKNVVTQYGNGIPYWPSTPGSNFEDIPQGKANGDLHSWKVWSRGVPFTDYSNEHPRFLSEFGFQSMPALATVRAFAGPEEDLNSPALQNHERFLHGYERMAEYLAGAFRKPRNFAAFIYLSQLEQAEAIKFAVETMRSRRPETMGALYWQLDDCWPVASWSSIDYFGRWKALHFYAARFYAPLLVTGKLDGDKLVIHLVSDQLQPTQAVLHLRLMSFEGSLLQEQRLPVDAAALASTALDPVTLNPFDKAATVAVLTLERGTNILASNTLYFTEPKDLKLPSPTISHTFEPDRNGFRLTLHSPVVARGVALDFGSLTVKLDSNFFDLLPREGRTIHLTTTASLPELEAAFSAESLATEAP